MVPDCRAIATSSWISSENGSLADSESCENTLLPFSSSKMHIIHCLKQLPQLNMCSQTSCNEGSELHWLVIGPSGGKGSLWELQAEQAQFKAQSLH